jgi:peptide-methionine (S)-S-oxide reductase
VHENYCLAFYAEGLQVTLKSPRSDAVSDTKLGGVVELNGKELATLGGGCFWCLEPIFCELIGVETVESGYSGGTVPNPTYEQVCSGSTGHAEVVQVTYDPKLISFKELLEIFFTIHDPTTLNRQGEDIGTQYRSIILYHNTEQKTVAEQTAREVESAQIWNGPLLTQVRPLEAFYRAEKYHQNYFRQNPKQPYCQFVISPKVSKMRQHYINKLKTMA